MKKLTPGAAYLVEWIDACFFWDGAPGHPDEEIGKPCRTIGFLVRQDDGGIRLAMESGEEGGDNRGYFDIPAAMILGIKQVVPPPRPTVQRLLRKR